MSFPGIQEKNSGILENLRRVEKHANYREINKSRCHEVFNEEPDLPFLIRKSTKSLHKYAITVNPMIQEGRKRTWRIKITNGGFKLSLQKTCKSLAKIFKYIEMENLQHFEFKKKDYLETLPYLESILKSTIEDFLDADNLIHAVQAYLSPDLIDATYKKINLHEKLLNSCSSLDPQVVRMTSELIEFKKKLLTIFKNSAELLENQLDTFLNHKMDEEISFLKEIQLAHFENEEEMTSVKEAIDKTVENLEEISEFYLKNQEYINNPYLNNLFHQEIPIIKAEAKRALDNLAKLFTPSYYHGLCSETRAKRLLVGKPDGSFLLRETQNLEQENKFVLSFVSKGNVNHQYFKMNALIEKEFISAQIYMENYIKQLCCTSFACPVPNLPLNHLEGQLEWNAAGASEERMLFIAEPEASFIIKNEAGSYTLCTMEKLTKQLIKYELSIHNNQIICQRDGRLLTSSSLFDLITQQLRLPYRLLYKKPEPETVEQLYYRRLLPFMQRHRLTWMKASRQAYPFLHRSLWVNQEGHIYEQFHHTLFETADFFRIPSENKMLKGKGGYKHVWALKPFYPNANQPAMVRSRFHGLPPGSLEAETMKLLRLKEEVQSAELLIPFSFSYKNSNFEKEFAQVMPDMVGGTLFHAARAGKLSYLGKLRAIYNLGLALLAMHSKGWAHRDVKPENVMLASTNEDYPNAKLIDFDFAAKLNDQIKSSRRFSTPQYADPAILKGYQEGIEEAKVNDQFSLGATIYCIFIGTPLRNELSTNLLTDWVEERQLNNRIFRVLNPLIQDIVRRCCIGPFESRPYRLPSFIGLIGELIRKDGNCDVKG